MDSWKKVLPDYELVHWNADRFDIDSVPFVREAYDLKQWAFAADYIRLYALYNEGGVYLDSDVIMKKPFDEFLNEDFFSAVEYHPAVVEAKDTLSMLNPDGSSKDVNQIKPGIGIQAAILGSVAGHPFLKDSMDYYHEKHFSLGNGELFNKAIAPDILAYIASNYGFRFVDERQRLDNGMLILESQLLAGGMSESTRDSYAIHLSNGSWRKTPAYLKLFKRLLSRNGKTRVRLDGHISANVAQS